MRLSQSLYKTLKDISSDEKSINAQLLIRAGMIDQVMAGVYTLLPMGLKTIRKIENIIREEINKTGANEILMPALQPKENREKTGRWDSLDNLFKFESFYSKHNYALGATHEEIVTPLGDKIIASYKDLPRATYQIQTKYRDEKRAKSGMLRGREFMMKDLYSFHTNEADLDLYYAKVQEAYKNIFNRLGIGDKTFLTYASGGSFTKYSHEYQTLTQSGEDIIYLDKEKGIALNKEIIDDPDVKKEFEGYDFVEEKSIEVGNIFKLMTKFSDSFDAKYVDQNNETKPLIMGCYGIGITRVMGAIVEVLHDDKGILRPKSIAPYKYILISIGEKGKARASEVYNKMIEIGMDVVWDDRDMGPGAKFKDADLIGYPTQIVIGDRILAEGDNAEITDRKTGNKELISIDELYNKLK